MEPSKTSQLYERDRAAGFYEDRYSRGYMEDWPLDTRQRVFEVIRSLDLPTTGEALDFGCGNGILTDVIRQALAPGWRVFGTDISSIAIENARTSYPACNFFVAGDQQAAGRTFDFLFTHHVLEHVYDLDQVLTEIGERLNDESAMLHILPCGNKGSFERSVCLMRRDGINASLGNRFFFEDEGHVRRLTTEELTAPCAEQGFFLSAEFYANQEAGAVNWLTRKGPRFIWMFADPSQAVNDRARSDLRRLRQKLVGIWALRYHADALERRLRQRKRTPRDYAFLALFTLVLPLYAVSKPADAYQKLKAREEWRNRRRERNGSEMYLFFTRKSRPVSRRT